MEIVTSGWEVLFVQRSTHLSPSAGGRVVGVDIEPRRIGKSLRQGRGEEGEEKIDSYKPLHEANPNIWCGTPKRNFL